MSFFHPHDQQFMARCLELARGGLGWVSPNPLVGCVIVKAGRIIGEGYHARVGNPHAEVNALAACREDPRGCTMYVNLEPCNHQGRTPPCTEAIIAASIARVVIGMPDPNPAVRGGGMERLTQAGLAVSVGVLERECRALNLIFIHWVTTGRPYVAAKVAIGSDYKIASAPGVRTQITGMESQRKAHELRQQYDAILVGSGTVIADNPELTVRLYPQRPRDPRRVILDTTLDIDLSAQVLRDTNVLIATTPDANPTRLAALKAANIPFLVTDHAEGVVNLLEVLDWCARNDITSILVEGGRAVFDRFQAAGLINHWYLFVGPHPLGAAGLDALSDLEPLKRCQATCPPQWLGPDVVYDCPLESASADR